MFSREFCQQHPALRDQRAQGMPGAGRARSLVCENKKAHKHSHHGHTGNTRHSPRNGFTAYSALSPGTGLSCPRHRRKSSSANLTPASGRQDHTTSPSAVAPLVLRRYHVHRIPHPTSVTIAKRPSEGVGPNRYIAASTSASREISENQKLVEDSVLVHPSRGQTFPASSGAKIIVSEK
jgi:hypothetical protein